MEFEYEPIFQLNDKTGFIIAEFEVMVDNTQIEAIEHDERFSCIVNVETPTL